MINDIDIISAKLLLASATEQNNYVLKSSIAKAIEEAYNKGKFHATMTEVYLRNIPKIQKIVDEYGYNVEIFYKSPNGLTATINLVPKEL